MPSQYDQLIQQAAETHLPGVDWRLIKAQYMAESRLDPNAVSPAGAQGIAQFMPGTWADVAKELGYPADITPFDPEAAIPAGAYYMAKLLNGWTAPRPEIDRYCLALASYNAGYGHLLKAQKAAGGANDYARIIRALPQVTGHHSAETTSYVKRILNYFNQMVTG
ncbi:soluble lytic murein transglycosylase-like protein [Marinobacterium sp. MBR-111]|jgi:membrane-bound lytic murein transglycosylase F|uniref:transglycosylase SLT domain-containing protein n=1 Tax=Marinobacterium sp. MBR-111 TaxID=3156463 RepID=UPI003398397A